jgi:hypothetical protein
LGVNSTLGFADLPWWRRPDGDARQLQRAAGSVPAVGRSGAQRAGFAPNVQQMFASDNAAALAYVGNRYIDLLAF